MAILINATILSDKNTGLGVYTYNILYYVCPILDEKNIDYQILCKDVNLLPDCCKKKAYEVKFNGFFQRNSVINSVGKQKFDLIYSTTQHGVLHTKDKQIVTVHDLMPIFYPKGRYRQWLYYKLFLPRILKKSMRVITVSESSKNDILRLYKKVPKDNVVVVSPSLLPQKNNETVNTDALLVKFKLKKQSYFCITGIHYPYKNIHSVIEAYKNNSDLKKYIVVVIGNDDCPYGKFLKKLVEKYSLSNYFLFTGYISEEEKNILLSNSYMCLYPSLYEGFGLPVLEAMRAGVPVVCNNLSSLPEVGGSAAIYCNFAEPRETAKKLQEIIDMGDAVRQDYIERGYENLKRFDWSISAISIAEIIETVIKGT